MSSPPSQSPARRVLRIAALIAMALAGALIIAFASHPAQKDYISYWSAGKLLLHHANPYSYTGVLSTEKSVGYTEARPLIMRNPPWAAFLVAPLGALTPLTGLLLWTTVSLACILAFVRFEKIPANDALLPFFFAPAAASLCAGQSSPLLLLGFVLFLHLHHRRPFVAGCSLLLLALKPHLFFLFWAILLLDCLLSPYGRGRLKLLAGLVVALVSATAVALLLDPQIWQHYIAMLHSAELGDEFLPTLSELFRIFVDVRAGWLIFLPTAIALVWAVLYYFRRRAHWNWPTHGMLLMLVAILTSPYGWFSDQIVLLPAITYALTATTPRKFATEILLALNCFILFIVLILHPPLTSVAYAWTPAAWLAWFLYANRKKSSQHTRPLEAELGGFE